jgi:hypothetical protein
MWEKPLPGFHPGPTHGDEDFPRTNVDACRIRLRNGAVIQRHPLSSAPVPSALSRLLLLNGHGLAFLLRQRPDRAKMKVLF